MVRLLAWVLCFVISSVSVQAQDELIGYWEGKMLSEYGKYTFTLSVMPQKREVTCDGYKSTVRAIATHNRFGKQEVIHLNGLMFQDQSVYLIDVNNRYKLDETGVKFSRLQFELKAENGQYILDGHWQEYHNIRQFRKGRLVLKKGKNRA